jgi:hypothetical protein
MKNSDSSIKTIPGVVSPTRGRLATHVKDDEYEYE